MIDPECELEWVYTEVALKPSISNIHFSEFKQFWYDT